jgi:hypothetical protein
MAHLGIHCRILAEAWKESATVITRVAITSLRQSSDSLACLAIRFCLEGFLDHPDDHPDDPSVSVWIRLTDGPSNVSRPDPSGAVQVDAEHPARNRMEGAAASSTGTWERSGA